MRKEKIGRNDPCPCGSGYKYKRCCLEIDQSLTIPYPEDFSSFLFDQEEEKKPLPLMTITKEPHMPVRLYYEIFDKEAFLVRLNSLQCVSWESEERFFINYCKESKFIGLTMKHNEVPESFYPVILAYGHIVDERHLHLDLRSFERASLMVQFIDKWISRDLVKVTHAATYNELLGTDQETLDTFMSLNFDEFFSDETIVVLDPEAKVREIKEAIGYGKNEEEKQEIIARILEEVADEGFDLIEKYPLHYYEDGIEDFDRSLMLRLGVAIEHWKGNIDCKPAEFIQHFIEEVPQLLEDDLCNEGD